MSFIEFSFDSWIKEIRNKASEFDLTSIEEQCNVLADDISSFKVELEPRQIEEILGILRRKRMFSLMIAFANSCIQAEILSPKIQRLFAQALIDSGDYTSAKSSLLNQLAELQEESKNLVISKEIIEIKGLLGRVYKQLFVNAKNPVHPKNQKNLKKSIQYYFEVYEEDDSQLWHGINVVALLNRALKDNISVPIQVDEKSIANSILSAIQKKYDDGKANAWDFATAAEACIALGELEEAIQWISGYSRMPYCDAFELSSTLRQLEEVWQLTLDSSAGQHVLPILRAELSKREGAEMKLNLNEIKQSIKTKNSVDQLYNSLVDKKAKEGENPILEKVFGKTTFQNYQWFQTALSRSLCVARIGLNSSKGLGSGFLIRGEDLIDNLNDGFYLVTNSHVVSEEADNNSIYPDEMVVIFEALNPEEEFSGLKVIWSSHSADLDTCILRFPKIDQVRLSKLFKDVKTFQPHPRLPAKNANPAQRIYVIGYPHGGTLQISFQDNHFLDHDDIKRMHYRTPTVGGSSGSPVFNQQWRLIGVHHAGKKYMPKLNGDKGTYEANQGIWIQAIINRMRTEKNT